MRLVASSDSQAGNTWTRRQMIILGTVVPAVASGADLWLPEGADARKKKKKRKKSSKKASAGWSLLPANYDHDAEELAFLGLINAYRRGRGIVELTLNSQLSVASASHSLDMGLHGFFDHVNRQGKDPGNRASAAGYRWAVIGENLAGGSSQDTAAEAFAMWQSSPHHNGNMLDRDFHDIGIGREQVPGSQYQWYWTTVLGSTS